MLPVLTRPDVVQQSVAGMLSGQIGLTMSNVEALLVLANAVGGGHISLCAAPQKHHVCKALAHLTVFV